MSERFVAPLRGSNAGSNNIIPNDDLRRALEEL